MPKLDKSPSSMRYIVMAEFEVKPDRFADFLELATKFSDECLDSEPGCKQFDVVQIETTPNAVLFYETYENISAFESHCVSAHLARFKERFPPMIFGEKALRRGVFNAIVRS